MVPIICVVGRSGSGKTLIVQRLVAEFKRRNYRVATIKHAPHGFDPDREGKDSWLHAGAGSDTAVVSSPERVAVNRRVDHDLSLMEVTNLIGPDHDIFIAEGFKKSPAPKIHVFRDGLGQELLCFSQDLIAVVSDETVGLGVPEFSPDEISRLVDLVEMTFLAGREPEMVTLSGNGEQIPMNEFVQSIFARTLGGMISSLKGVPDEVQSIDISVRLPAHTTGEETETAVDLQISLDTLMKLSPVR